MAAAAILNFGKMSIPLDWIKISAPYFMEICVEAMRRWPRDQMSKPEVTLRDVIKWTSEAQVRRSQWLQHIFEPNSVHTTNIILSRRRNGQIHIIWKSKMAAADILNFGKISITSDCIKIYSPNFMRRCIMVMRRWPRDQMSKPEVNSRDVINKRLKHKCVDLIGYSGYLNQIWHKAQIPHYQHAGIVKLT